MTDLAAARQAMVADLAARGIRSPRVLQALAAVPRETFVPATERERAYDDIPLPIGEEQTISQPYIVAYMIEALALAGGERVLEVGAGSGYAAAVMARIVREVFAVERRPALAASASARLAALGFDNVHIVVGDGSQGWPAAAPYDAIVVAAGGPAVPAPLREQLAIGGRLVMPVGAAVDEQRLVRVRRIGPEAFVEEPLVAVRFVPLIGAVGWQERVP